MDETIKALASQMQGLKSIMTAMQASSQALQQLPTSLSKAATNAISDMTASSKELTHQADRFEPPTAMQTLLQMLGAAVLGALLVLVGQAVLNRLL